MLDVVTSWFKEEFIQTKIKIKGLIMGASTCFLLIGGQFIYIIVEKRERERELRTQNVLL